MEEVITDVNWLAVIVGFVVSFVLGAVWYSPKLFGNKWAEGVGIDMSEKSAMSMPAMVSQTVGVFLMSWVVGITAKNDQLITILLVALTLIFLVAANGFFTKKSAYARHTEVGFIAAMTVVMIACQGIF